MLNHKTLFDRGPRTHTPFHKYYKPLKMFKLTHFRHSSNIVPHNFTSNNDVDRVMSITPIKTKENNYKSFCKGFQANSVFQSRQENDDNRLTGFQTACMLYNRHKTSDQYVTFVNVKAPEVITTPWCRLFSAPELEKSLYQQLL